MTGPGYFISTFPSASLEVAIGQIKGKFYKRNRRREFLDYALKGQSFQSVKELMIAIESYMEVYNEAAHPFEWTKEKVIL
jgi:FAD synthase